MTKDLTTRPSVVAEAQAHDEEKIEVGQWFWIDGEEKWLACVTHVGSNYARVESPHRSNLRIHFDDWNDWVLCREENPDKVVNDNVKRHQREVDSLLNEIKLLTAKLGLVPAGELPEHGASQGLVVAHGTKNINAHKKALVKAKEKTLPDLFKKVEEEHAEMAIWMKAKLIPMKAEASTLRGRMGLIEDRIFTVELYAGLCEEVTCIRKGKTASNDEKVHLFQRRHYMDEECLLYYESGGMEFRDIKDFDKWLMKKKHRDRILPLPKCVVAFQVRRFKMPREAESLSDFIKFADLIEMDKLTYLYIRNGNSYYRLSTGIKFDNPLFPDEQHSDMFHGAMYVNVDRFGGEAAIISEQDYKDRKAQQARAKKDFKIKLKKWKAEPEDTRSHFEPYYHDRFRHKYERLTPDTVYYDDGMQRVASAAKDHNRLAVVLQGLLDRSPVFHPHPPWKLWTPEGFTAGIELVYDEDRVITHGPPPDFEAYRDRLNESIKKGTHVIGQRDAWMRYEAVKENARQRNDWRIRDAISYDRFAPYGNPGPKLIAPIDSMMRDGRCRFNWERERQRIKWIPNPDRYGWNMSDKSLIKTHFKCKKSLLFNVDAYQLGDFKQFYEDHRTRADYIKWAPFLLAAEDFVSKSEKDHG